MKSKGLKVWLFVVLMLPITVVGFFTAIIWAAFSVGMGLGELFLSWVTEANKKKEVDELLSSLAKMQNGLQEKLNLKNRSPDELLAFLNIRLAIDKSSPVKNLKMDTVIENEQTLNVLKRIIKDCFKVEISVTADQVEDSKVTIASLIAEAKTKLQAVNPRVQF